MGIGDYQFLDLIQKKIRSWFSTVSGTLDMSEYCRDCQGSLPGTGCGHRCRSCGRLFCRKCVQVVSEQQFTFCGFCLQAINRHVEGSEGPQPDSPPSRIRNSRLAHLAELSNFSSPRSPRYNFLISL